MARSAEVHICTAYMAQQDLGTWDMARGTCFPISQMAPAHMAQHNLGTWEMAGSAYFPFSQMTPAYMAQHIWPSYLGNWEMARGTEVLISEFSKISKMILTQMAQHYLGNWESGKP